MTSGVTKGAVLGRFRGQMKFFSGELEKFYGNIEKMLEEISLMNLLREIILTNRVIGLLGL